MHQSLRSILTQVCFRSGLLYGLQRLGDRVHLHRRHGRLEFPYLTNWRAPGFQILTYHRLTKRRDPFFAGIDVELFKQQVGFLVRNYAVMDLAEIVRRLDDGQAIPRNAVALTFDDGYRDNYELAFPILESFQIPATVFLTTGFVNREGLLWNDKISYAVKHTRKKCLTFGCQDTVHFPLHTVGERLVATRTILFQLLHDPHAWKLALTDALLKDLDVHDFGDLWDSMLTWDQIRRMKAKGIRFGAHTVTHPILSRLPLEEARREILESKEAIEAELNEPVELFAFPVGRPADFNSHLKKTVRELGFRAAVTTIFGTNTGETDRFQLRRVGLDEPDLASFAVKHCWYKLVM